MTLKKFLKKYIELPVDVYSNGEYLGQSIALDKKHKEWRVDKVFPAYSKSDLRCGIVAINIEPPKEKKPKRSTDNKSYKKWMRKYVKDHMDEIGLKDGGYAGDSAEEDKPCEYAMKNPITGNYHCVKWMFTECDCGYMRIESPVCAFCDKQIEG